MSTATARLRAAVEQPSAGEAGRPDLRVVQRRAAIAGRLPFAVLVGGILAGGLIALLLLHTMAAQDAFRLRDLQRQAADLRDTQQQLEIATQRLQAPGELAARARGLGMVATGSISFVRLRSGRLVGVAHAAPSPAPVPSASTAPAPGASSGPAATNPAGCPHAHCRPAHRR